MFPKGTLEDIEEGTKLLAILDEDWPAFLQEERCMDRARLNRWIVPLDEGGKGEEFDGYFKTTIRQVRSASCWTYGMGIRSYLSPSSYGLLSTHSSSRMLMWCGRGP